MATLFAMFRQQQSDELSSADESTTDDGQTSDDEGSTTSGYDTLASVDSYASTSSGSSSVASISPPATPPPTCSPASDAPPHHNSRSFLELLGDNSIYADLELLRDLDGNSDIQIAASRITQVLCSPLLPRDVMGLPPVEERGDLFYLVIYNLHSVRRGTLAMLVSMVFPLGSVMDASTRPDGEGYALYLSFASIEEA